MYIEENIKTKVTDEYDVAVCGGGFAGISAALAAARQGKRVVLFEKIFMLGGLGTAGLVTIYLPICDGMGHQVCYGIAEELFRLSISHGNEGRYPANWLDNIGERNEKTQRFEVQYNPQMFAIMAEKLLTDAGVTVMYGTYAVGVSMENGKITHLITENKSGREAYKVKSVVDATGDCDIAKFADAPTETFKNGNVLAAWYYYTGKTGYGLKALGFCDIPDEEKTAENAPVNPAQSRFAGDSKGPEMLAERRFTGLDGKELSEQVCMSHQSVFNDVLQVRKNDDTFAPVTIATIPQVRMTRRIDGDYTLSYEEEHKYFEDSVGMVPNWRRRGPVYEVPFRSLYSSKVKNLICAGRCTSVDDVMWDLMRVIPCCAVTGEAAGVAAAMTDDFTTLDVKELQAKLVDAGVKLHEKDIM